MAAKKPDSLPVKKPPPPQPVERLETTSLEAIGATLEEEKPKPKSDIATVIGIPALPDPTLPNNPPATEEKKSDPAVAATVLAPPAKRSLKKKSVPVETTDGEPPAPPAEVLEAQRALEASPPSDAPAPLPATAPRIPTPEPEPAVPTTSPIDSLKVKIDEIIKGPRPRLYMFAGIAGAVVLIFVGVIIRLIRGSPSDETASTASSASASSSGAPPPAPTSTEAPVAVAPAPKIPTCTASRDSKSIAPRGVVAAGLELVMLDGVLALGWASGPKEATVAMLDPATGGAQSTSGMSAPAALKRVIPRAPSDKTILDTDGKAARPIGSYEVGSSGGNITINGKPLWKLESSGSAEALRGAVTTDGIVIAYRHAGAIFAGATKGTEAAAPPIRVGGLGMQVGSPAIAANGSHVIVVWADRAEASHPWSLRYFTWTLGQPPNAPEAFPLPENTMSPSLTSLAGGFLLVWTEGPNEHQQVRVRVLDFDGKPKGEAMTVSPEGVHSGQGQAAVLPDGRGVIAFLADKGSAFEVRTTTMRCD